MLIWLKGRTFPGGFFLAAILPPEWVPRNRQRLQLRFAKA